jgi:hypothetical protein
MCHLVPLPHLPYTMELVECKFQQVFRLMGFRGTSSLTAGPSLSPGCGKPSVTRPGVALSLSSGYRPQTNRQTERLNQKIGKYLRQQYSAFPHDWSRYMAWAEYAHNSLMHSSLGLTLFQCVLGYQPPMFAWEVEPGTVPAVND